MENLELYIIIILFIMVIYFIYTGQQEHILARPTYYGTMEDVYKSRIKNKKGLNFNDYKIEQQFLENKYMTNNDRIL